MALIDASKEIKGLTAVSEKIETKLRELQIKATET